MRWLAAFVLLASGSVASASEFALPEISATITVSGQWVPRSADVVREKNDSLNRQRPQNITRFIAGFVRGKVAADSIPTEYLWIQRTPIATASVTPEMVVAMLPKVVAKNREDWESKLKIKIKMENFQFTYQLLWKSVYLQNPLAIFTDGSHRLIMG